MFAIPRLIVRAGPAIGINQIREAVTSVDPDLFVHGVERLEDVVAGQRVTLAFALRLMSLFGLIGLTLATTGIYGLLSDTFGQRRRELSIRAALGADRHTLLTLVLKTGLVIVATGVAFGWLGGWAASRYVSSLLFERSSASKRDSRSLSDDAGCIAS